MPKKLSSSFTSSTTRGMSHFDMEVESRSVKKMDLFTDEFSPPGASEVAPSADVTKRDAPYEKAHEDYAPEGDEQFWDKSKIARANQEKLDWLDQIEYRIQAPVKSPYDQFPGDVDMEEHREQAAIDPHQTDPARLMKMDKAKKIDGPESFDKEVEKRMKQLTIEKAPKQVEPKWNSGKNPDQEMSKKKGK